MSIGAKPHVRLYIFVDYLRPLVPFIPNPLESPHALVKARPWRSFPHPARHGNAILGGIQI